MDTLPGICSMSPKKSPELWMECGLEGALLPPRTVHSYSLPLTAHVPEAHVPEAPRGDELASSTSPRECAIQPLNVFVMDRDRGRAQMLVRGTVSHHLE